MQSVMLRVSARCYTLRELSAQTGESMQSMVDEAIELYRRRRFLEEVNAAYMPLRQNAETWRAVEQERSEWDIALGDGLPKIYGPLISLGCPRTWYVEPKSEYVGTDVYNESLAQVQKARELGLDK